MNMDKKNQAALRGIKTQPNSHLHDYGELQVEAPRGLHGQHNSIITHGVGNEHNDGGAEGVTRSGGGRGIYAQADGDYHGLHGKASLDVFAAGGRRDFL